MTEDAQVPQEAGNTEVTSEQGNWYSDDYKDVVERTGWKDPNDAIKSYRELEQMSSGKVKLPEDDATWAKVLESDEEKEKLRDRLGIPKPPASTEDYQIALDESLDGIRDIGTEEAMKAIALEQGVPKQAFESMVQSYYQAMAEGMKKSYEDGQTALRDELGDKYDESLKVAQRFIENTSPEFKELLEATGLGNNPVVVKEFMTLGKKTLSDSIIKGTPDKQEDPNWKPAYPDSPDMYAYAEGPDGERARAYFTKRGHKY
jgi:hypothetical protein